MTARPLHDYLRQSAATYPTHTALSSGTEALSYRELDEASDALAASLQIQGVTFHDRVGLCLPKSLASVVALYATLKSGASYVPIDVRTPLMRLLSLLIDSDCRVVFTTPGIASQVVAIWPPEARMPLIKQISFPNQRPPTTDTENQNLRPASHEVVVDADRPAAILYTSGSTGQPKGVVLTHRNISCFVEWSRNHFQLQPTARIASLAPLHFDLSTFDLFAAHSSGAATVLIDEKAAMFPKAVAAILEKERISICYAVPTTWNQLANTGGLHQSPLPDLRHVLFAGEVFPLPQLRRLMNLIPHATFTNLYGPVETNVCTHYTVLTPPTDGMEEIPIGHACAHASVLLIADDGNPVSPGEIGEICVMGPSVTPGYWRQPQQTSSSRLRGNPLSYRTGDLGIQDPDGTIRFRGRRDHQVKLRGHRIDLGELEAVFCRHPKVRQAVAILDRDQEREDSLIVFVQLSAPGPSPTDLQRHAAEWLPSYARPTLVVIREDFPLTTTGKIDRTSIRNSLLSTIASGPTKQAAG